MDLVTLAAAKSYINKRIDEVEIVTGATPQQAAQIEQNKTNIADLQAEIEDKQPKDDYVKTVNGNKPDATGNVVVATGGNGSGQNLTLDTTLTQSGKAADAQATGDEIKRVEEKIPSIEGLAKTEDIPDVPSWAMQASKPTYTSSEVGALPDTYTPPNQTAEQVGADPKGTAAGAVSAHNTSTAAHNDIRQELAAINARLTAFFDSDNQTLDELSEIVAYITSNKSLIDAIATSKVSVADIVNNLTTNVANKPLSAAQGVAIKALIDGLSASLGNYQPKGNYALASAVPTKVSQLQNDAKYLKAVTAAMITAALGYTPINPGLATLARHEDGLLYLFVDGKPVGSGVELPTGGIDGYVDADKNIVVRGLDEGVTYKFYFELADGSLVEGGELVYDNTVYYTVTNTLTNCANSNRATQVIEGESYAATITAKSGYELKTVTVTMGGSPVSVSGGKINIANVTGNIVITAVAEEKVVEPSYTNLFDPSKAVLNSRLNSAKDVVTDANATGKIITNFMNIVGKTPFTSDTKVYIKGATFTPDGNTKVLSFKNKGTTDYTAVYSQLNGSAVAVTDEGNGVISFTGASQNIASTFASDIKQMVLVLKVSDSAITTADIQDIVITIDEPIA